MIRSVAMSTDMRKRQFEGQGVVSSASTIVARAVFAIKAETGATAGIKTS